MNVFLKLKLKLNFLLRKRLKISSNFIHSQIKDYYYPVKTEEIKNYNEAVRNDSSEIPSKKFKENLHPLFYTKISWQIIKNLNNFLEEPIDDRILETIVHQSEYITFHTKLKLPAKLKVQSKIWSVKAHKKGTKILIKFDYYSDGELIATEYSGGLLFGVKCKGESDSLGNLPVSERFNTPGIWKKEIHIDKLLPYIYAEKAEINAPIHTNPKFAKSIGLPDIILQGTCTFAKAVNIILEEMSDDNGSKIKSVSAKFTGMLVVPNKITVRLLKIENKIFKFDVLNNEGKGIIKGGEVVLY